MLNLPERYKNVTLDELQHNDGNKQLIDLALQHVEIVKTGKLPSRGIFCYGQPGNGKSHVIFALCNCLDTANNNHRQIMWEKEIEKRVDKEKVIHDKVRREMFFYGIPDLFTITVCKFRDLLRSVAESWKKGGNPVREITQSHVVVIDDLTVRTERGNANSPYQWAYEATNELLDDVWDRQGLLYVTSNNTRIELAQAFGDAFFDRVDGLCETIENKDISHRRSQK